MSCGEEQKEDSEQLEKQTRSPRRSPHVGLVASHHMHTLKLRWPPNAAVDTERH